MPEFPDEFADAMISIRLSLSRLIRASSRHVIVVALFIGAESLLIYLVISTIIESAGFPFWLILLLLGTSHAAFTIYHQPWQRWVRQIGVMSILVLVGGGALLAAADGFPVYGTLILLLLSIAILIGLGWQRASYRQHLDFHDAYQLLRAGVIVFTVLGILGILTKQQAESELVGGIVVFFGLMLAAISEIHKLRERTTGWDDTTPRIIALLLVLPVVALGFVTFIIASLISTSTRQTLNPFGGIAQAAANRIGSALNYVVWFLILIIYTPLSWLVSLLFGADRGEYVPDTDPSPGPIPPAEGDFTAGTELLLQLLLFLFTAIVIFLIIRYTWHKIPWPASSDDGPGPIRSSVFRWRDLVPGCARRRDDNHSETAPDPLSRLRVDPNFRYTVAIRESYLAFQQHGQVRGCGRRKGESAPEYSQAVTAFMDESPAIDRLTRIYRRARYSGRPAAEQEAEEALLLLETVRQSASLEPSPEILRGRLRRRIP